MITLQWPQHQKTNKHILVARMWYTFSIQPRQSLTILARSHNHVSYNLIWIKHIFTRPILYNVQYHFQRWIYDTAKQNTNHQYDAFAQVYLNAQGLSSLPISIITTTNNYNSIIISTMYQKGRIKNSRRLILWHRLP